MTRWQEIGDYLHRIFSYLYHALTEEKNIDNFIEEKNEDKRSEGKEERKHAEEKGCKKRVEDKEDNLPSGSSRSLDLEREFLVQYYKTVTDCRIV